MYRKATIAFAIAAVVSFSLPRHSDAQTPVRVSEVRLERLQQRQMVTGSLRAIARGDVAALESGRLNELTAREGDTIAKGDVIARVDDRRLQAERKAAEADRRVAEAELKRHRATAKQAAANLARGEKLIRQNAVSRQELDQFRAASDVATAEIEAAQRRIERASETIRLLDVRLSDTTVIAPYDASVVARHVEPGDWVQPGDKLLTLVSTGPVEAWLEVPERYAPAISDADAKLTINSDALGRTLDVLNVKKLTDVNRRVRTMSVIATISNSDRQLAPGMSIHGWVPAGKSGDYLTVPKDAIVRRAGQPAVFAVNEDQKAQQIAVRVLFETSERVAVESPRLSAGSAIVVEGNERLMPQQLVQVMRDPSRPAMAIASR